MAAPVARRRFGAALKNTFRWEDFREAAAEDKYCEREVSCLPARTIGLMPGGRGLWGCGVGILLVFFACAALLVVVPAALAFP